MVTKTNKLPLKDILAAIDMNAKNVWDELSDDERKQVSFYLLNRYVSAIKGKTEDKQLQIFKTNQYYNKNFFTLTKHKKLLWVLTSMCGAETQQFHPWIKPMKRVPNKSLKKLQQIYPTWKEQDLETLDKVITDRELEELIEAHGIDK